MLIELTKGVALGLAVSGAVSIPAYIWLFFYTRSRRNKKAQ
ncbi:hypothetical protein [Streptomyces sp. NPDC093589]